MPNPSLKNSLGGFNPPLSPEPLGKIWVSLTPNLKGVKDIIIIPFGPQIWSTTPFRRNFLPICPQTWGQFTQPLGNQEPPLCAPKMVPLWSPP